MPHGSGRKDSHYSSRGTRGLMGFLQRVYWYRESIAGHLSNFSAFIVLQFFYGDIFSAEH
ncbi:unnamed protein product [Ixodes pacificus]